MAEINLLKTPTASKPVWPELAGAAVKLLAVLVVAVIGYYGYLFFKLKSVDSQLIDTQTQIKNEQSSALSMPDRKEFLTRQEQLKDFISLSAAHPHFSNLLPALAKVTLKNAFFTGLTVSTPNKLDMRVVTPTLQDIDKFLQVFDQPEVYKNFYNIRMSSFSKGAATAGAAYTFTIQAEYNPAIIAGGEEAAK